MDGPFYEVKVSDRQLSFNIFSIYFDNPQLGIQQKQTV